MKKLYFDMNSNLRNTNLGQVEKCDSIKLEIKLLQDVDYSDSSFRLLGNKADKNKVEQKDNYILEENKVIFTLKREFLTCPGIVKLELNISTNIEEYTTNMFYFFVSDTINSKIIESIQDVETIQELENYIKNANDNLDKVSETSKELDYLNSKIKPEEEKRLQAEAMRLQNEKFRNIDENNRKSSEKIREENEDSRNTSEEERVINEETRKNNELKRKTAENLRVSRENSREEAELQRQNLFEENESVRNESENARIKNETLRIKSEKVRITNEDNRILQEENRSNNEETREISENARIEAEKIREQQEDHREQHYNSFNEAENERVSNEEKRQEAEIIRNTGEESRNTKYEEAELVRNTSFEEAEKNRSRIYNEAENERAENEKNRIIAESKRNSKEDIRVKAEETRVSAETKRVEAENLRKTAETSRDEAEKIRVAADALRDEKIDKFGSQVTKIVNKVSDIVIKGNNLFNKEDVEFDKYLDNGRPTEHSSVGEWCISNFIEVKANTSYSATILEFSYFYASDKTVIKRIETNNNTFITPENCKYVRFSIRCNRLNEFMFNKGDNLLPFVKYEKYLNPEIKIKQESILEKNNNELINFTKTKNLFNEKAVIFDKYLDNGNVSDNSNGWKISDFIKVDPKTDYVLSREFKKIPPNNYCFFYDENKIKIGNINENPFTTPDNCKYVRFSIQNEIDFMQLEQGREIGYYIPFGYNHEHLDILKSKWLGKKYCCIGDSLTDGSHYPRILARGVGMILIFDNGRYGTTVGYNPTYNMGGETTSMCTDTRVNLVPLDTEVVTIMGGANDWAGQGMPLGNLNDEPTHETFYGAYQLLIKKLYNRIPNLRIIILQQTYRADAKANSHALEFDDYRKATEKIAYKFGLPFLRIYEKAGMNAITYKDFLQDIVHPNFEGQKRIANICIAGFKSIES